MKFFIVAPLNHAMPSIIITIIAGSSFAYGFDTIIYSNTKNHPSPSILGDIVLSTFHTSIAM